MARKRVWYPDKSLVLHEGSEESAGKGVENSPTQASRPIVRRRTARIVRRKEPTVDVRASSSLARVSDKAENRGGYSTIEYSPHRTLDLLDVKIDEMRDGDSEMCGWRQDEHKIIQSQGHLLHTTKDGHRSIQPRELPSSRLLSGTRISTSRKKKEKEYTFTHLKTADEYMKQYNALCSYTVSTISPQAILRDPDRFEEEGVVDNETAGRWQCSDAPNKSIYKPNGRRASSKQTSSPLVDLASRIGVQNSLRQQQLLKHRTPPSISKKRNEDRDDLILQAQGPKKNPQKSISRDEGSTQQKAHELNNPQRMQNPNQVLSRPPTQASCREKLPVIVPHAKHNSTSTISVSKYLQINHSDSLEERRKEEEVEGEECTTVHSTSTMSSSSSNMLHSYHSDNYAHTKPEKPKWPTFPSTAVDPLFDNPGKGEILRRKADSLGLLSHKWAKSFLERGFMRGCLSHQLYNHLSRPATRDSTRPNDKTDSQNVQPRPLSRGQANGRTVDHEVATGGGGTDRLTTSRKQKMEMLESVYGGKKSTTKYHPISVATATDTASTTRPPTRTGDFKHTAALHKLSHRLKEHHHSSSRPSTREKHHRMPLVTNRPSHKRWRNEEVVAGPPQIAPKLEGLISLAHQS